MRPFHSLLPAFVLFLAVALPLAAQQIPAPVVGEATPYGLEPHLGDAVLEGTSLIWRHEIFIPEGSFLKPHFAHFDLRPGDALIMRSHAGRIIEELTGSGPKGAGTFWGLSAFGNRFSLELVMARSYDVAPFKIDKIIVGNEDILGSGVAGPESICGPGDFEDVICYDNDPEKWATVFASVGVMSVGGNATTSLFCSGSNLIGNNVLTNSHCVSSQGACTNTEFVFKYYRTGCNDGSPATADWESFRCDQLLIAQIFNTCEVGSTNQDFSLFSVIGDPAATYGAVEPDPIALTDGEAIYIVQHPAGRPHEVTHGSGANVDADGFNLRYYDTLDTEGGSSGSPIYRESDNKLVGLHHCGGCSSPGVGNRGMMMSEIYPHIAPFLPDPALLTDGFESGDTSAWDVVSP